MNPNDTKALRQALDELLQERDAAAIAFEAKESFEMAYVARWSVVETSVKRILYAEAVASLRPQLEEWQKFLDDPSRKAPNPIRHFPIDSSKAKLPTAEDLKKRYSAAPNLLELLDSTKKYRKRRNSIAHSAEAFGQRATYEEYKTKVAAATAELREALSSAKTPRAGRVDA
jgi:hypothetical protein